jgi:hypothetical protein
MWPIHLASLLLVYVKYSFSLFFITQIKSLDISLNYAINVFSQFVSNWWSCIIRFFEAVLFAQFNNHHLRNVTKRSSKVTYSSFCESVCHLHEIVSVTYMKLCLSPTWNCVCHMKLCLSLTWNCVCHLHEIVSVTYVKLCHLHEIVSVTYMKLCLSLTWKEGGEINSTGLRNENWKLVYPNMSSPSTAKVRNTWSSNFTSPYAFMICCLM